MQWHPGGGGGFDVLSIYKYTDGKKKVLAAGWKHDTQHDEIRLKIYRYILYFCMKRCDVKKVHKWTDVLSRIHKVGCAALWFPCGHKGVEVWFAFPCLKLEYESPVNISTKRQSRQQG